MLGLSERGEVEAIDNMVKNFASLIDRYGFVPNGNRSYYLSRSQPPYFSLMVELLANLKGQNVYVDNLGEYKGQDGFGWTNGVSLKLIRLYGVPRDARLGNITQQTIRGVED